jgi:hypothetical protein
MTDLLLIDAEYELAKYGNIEPFCELIEDGNPYLWEDKKYRDLICTIIRGGIKSVRKGRADSTKRKREERDKFMLCRLYFHKGRGVQIWGRNEKGKLNACDLVSNEILSYEKEFLTKRPESIHKQIWKNHKPKPSHYEYFVEGYITAKFEAMAHKKRDVYFNLNKEERINIISKYREEAIKICKKQFKKN